MNVDDVIAELIQWRPASAQVWSYTASHAVLEIRLTRRRGENLHLILSACKYFQAQTAWGHAAIKIELEEDEHGTVYRVTDDAAQLLIKCRMIGIQHNVVPVY
jgi:hypothetical protein